MKNLSYATKQEKIDFLNSFDQILCDVDGVLWTLHKQIPGALDAVLSLRKMHKKIIFVSNNCTKPSDTYFNQLKAAGYAREEDALVTPSMAMISHLKKANFTKEIYVVGMRALRSDLESAGFAVAELGPHDFQESVPKFCSLSVLENEKVGAVIADFDVNVTWLKLQRGATYLKRPEVIFIAGGGDNRVLLRSNETLIGPGFFQSILEDITQREPIRLAKPSLHFSDFIKEKFALEDASRVLFIGDSIPEDMAFAANSGYKKLLVLSGLTNEDHLKKWTYPEEYKPDYYVNSLKTLHEIIRSLK